MADITITLDRETEKILERQAEKNLFSLKEQIEDILRKSAIRQKSRKKCKKIKIDDRLIRIFSRDKRGRSKKTKKTNKKSKKEQ